MCWQYQAACVARGCQAGRWPGRCERAASLCLLKCGNGCRVPYGPRGVHVWMAKCWAPIGAPRAAQGVLRSVRRAGLGVPPGAGGTGGAMGNAKETPVKNGRRKGGEIASSSIGNLARDATGWRGDRTQKDPPPSNGWLPSPGIGPMPSVPLAFSASDP